MLEARNDAFLERKAAELLAGVCGINRPGGMAELEAEIRREVSAYEPEGLIVVVREPGRVSVAPGPPLPGASPLGRCRRAARARSACRCAEGRYRVLRRRPRAGWPVARARDLAGGDRGDACRVRPPRRRRCRRLPGPGRRGGPVPLAAGPPSGGREHPGGPAARPENLSERLPLTGAGDELDELAGTINGLLDRLAAYHAQVIRFTADASHELRSPLAAMRAAVEVALQKPRTRRNTGTSSRRSASSASG